jgi:adenylate kinase
MRARVHATGTPRCPTVAARARSSRPDCTTGRRQPEGPNDSSGSAGRREAGKPGSREAGEDRRRSWRRRQCGTRFESHRLAVVIALLVAPPGAGKGTQGRRLAEHYGVAFLSSGELLRANVAAGTPVGRLAASYLDRGDLVPDDVVFELMEPEVVAAARAGGCILDGFPRSLQQARRAEALFSEVPGQRLVAVVELVVGAGELRSRLSQRETTEGRSDDVPATIQHRLEVYEAETEPLLAYYDGRGLLARVDGEGDVDEVFSAVVAAIDARLGDEDLDGDRASA